MLVNEGCEPTEMREGCEPAEVNAGCKPLLKRLWMRAESPLRRHLRLSGVSHSVWARGG